MHFAINFKTNITLGPPVMENTASVTGKMKVSHMSVYGQRLIIAGHLEAMIVSRPATTNIQDVSTTRGYFLIYKQEIYYYQRHRKDG